MTNNRQSEIESVKGPRLLDARQLAKMLSYGVRTVWRLRASGAIPAPIQVGQGVRWNADTIRHWIDLGCPDRDTFERVTKDGRIKRVN